MSFMVATSLKMSDLKIFVDDVKLLKVRETHINVYTLKIGDKKRDRGRKQK